MIQLKKFYPHTILLTCGQQLLEAAVATGI